MAQQVIEKSRTTSLEDFVTENCMGPDIFQYNDPYYKKEMWEWFKSWHSDSSILAGIIFENAIIADSNGTHIDLKPLLSSYLDTLIWREITSCVIFGLSIFIFIVVSLGFVLCRILNDRVVSFEETSNGLWKIKWSIYILTSLLCALCLAYIVVSIVIIINFVAFSRSFSSSVCWLAVGAEALSNGNININTATGSFNVTEISLKTNTTVPFIGSLPLYGLFQELGSIEAIVEIFNETINYIGSAGFPTTLSRRLTDLVFVFTNASLISPTDVNWYIPAKETLKSSVLNAANSFLPVNETLFNSMAPILKRMISILNSVDTSSMSFSVTEYFEVFQKFISHILLFLNFSRTGSAAIFGVITALCSSSILVGIISIIFSILHIKLFLSGKNHIGFFQTRSALVAVAFIFLGLSTIISLISYSLTVAGTVGKDYCGWLVKDLFSQNGMNWISTVSPELGMIMGVCMYPLASYIKIKNSEVNSTENEYLMNRTHILKSHGLTHKYLEVFNQLQTDQTRDYNLIKEPFSNSSQLVSPFFFDKIKHFNSNESLLNESYIETPEIKNREMAKKDYISDLILANSDKIGSGTNSSDILLAEQFSHQEVVGLLNGLPINSSISSLLFQIIPSNFVDDMSKLVPEYLNIISTSQTIADQCFNYVNVTDYIKYSLMYFPDVERSSIEEQNVPVLVLITQSYKNEDWLIKSSIFSYTTYAALSSSPNAHVSTLMISQSLPFKTPGLQVLESIIYPFRIKYLVDHSENPSIKHGSSLNTSITGYSSYIENAFDPISSLLVETSSSEESLFISADTNIDHLNLNKYHKENKYFMDYPLSSFKNTLEWVKKSMKLYRYHFFCYPFSWLDIKSIRENPSFGNNSLYIKYYNHSCNYVEFQEYITSISYDYIINPTDVAAHEVERLNLILNERIRKMFGSALILNSIKSEAHNCGQVSVDFTNGIVTLCGMIGKTKDKLIVILNIITFIGYAISIIIGIIWVISLRYESRIADSIMEIEQSSNESIGNSEKDDHVNLKINSANIQY
ncbi:putative signal peptide-containing protein [Cryptosporidium canis]|uniref:Signal peptide-containing protein n=1 Tax=Cryptosporidium canis TaxID=195482 RepID=A0A9D5DHV2_9CRYT|nr:putative signal peptide-containing protein [Cryptosporidium canis]